MSDVIGLGRLVSRLAAVRQRGTHSPVRGAMADHVGRAYSRAELAASEYLEGDALDRVRAYPVPALAGAVLVAPTEATLPRALEALLRERVGDFDWTVAPAIVGPLRKYGLLHSSVVAPVDEGRGEPMWLELVGEVVALGGAPVGDRDWFDLRPLRPSELVDVPLSGPVEIRIDTATYSTTRDPGLGAPFYS